VRITHLTVLNPYTHSRIFWKEALTLREAGHSVSIIGRKLHDPIGEDEAKRVGIRLIGLPSVRRFSWRRIALPWRIYRLARNEYAEVYHIHTPELLLIGLWLRVRTGAKIVYDVHEDYRANYRNARSGATLLYWIAGTFIRVKENLARPYLSGIIYAEMSYKHLGRGKRTAVIRNTYRPVTTESLDSPETLFPPGIPRLCSTGTLSPDWGTTKALYLWAQLNMQTGKPYGLHLAGQYSGETVPASVDFQLLIRPELTRRFVLTGGSQYVPLSRIHAVLRASEVSLALYLPLPHLVNKIPTRFYEALGMGKPIVFFSSPYWEALNEKYQIGLSLPYRDIHPNDELGQKELLAEQLPLLEAFIDKVRKEGWHTEAPISFWSWETDADALLAFYQLLD
jgi:hypothetical protein